MGKANRIIKLVDRMRRNSEEMRSWQNYALAQEAFALLKSLDDPEEDAEGKALACNAIVDQLSEYDTPRFCMEILRWALEQMEAEGVSSESLSPEDLRGHIAKLEDWIAPERVSDAEFKQKYGRMLAWDPIERDPVWEELYPEVEAEVDREMGDAPRGMGFCFGYWSAKRGALAKRGIEWRDPHSMNPRVMFD